MNLKTFYKNNIKSIAAQLKEVKPAFRRMQSLNSKGLGLELECTELSKKLLYVNIPALKTQARYLNLAYAVIRGKDLSKVETNPRIPHDEKVLAKLIEKMGQDFNAQNKETSNV